MNTITFGIGCILANLLVVVSSDEYKLLSETKVTRNGPYNFSFQKLNGFLVMEIILKNIPKPVTEVVLIYTTKPNFFSKESKSERKVDTEIKNGEVKFIIQKSLNDHNILVDVELHIKGDLCKKSRVAEGRYESSPDYYYNKQYIYWHTNWNHDDKGYCVVPEPCEIVMDFNNRCENFNCYFEATKYICTINNEKKNNKSFKLYQTYENVNYEPKTMVSFPKDYSYLEAGESYYKIHTTKKNWFDANKVCVQEGASLFYPEDGDEVAAVVWLRNSKTKENNMYVGISDIKKEGVYETIDGRPISEIYHKWNLNQPDNYKNNEHCVHITKNEFYNDIPCNTTYGFICKKSLLSPERNIKQNLSSLIGTPLDITNINTKLIIELELFDMNTSVNVVPSRFFRKYKLWSNKIILTAKDVVSVKDSIVRTLNYSETIEVEFSCEEYNFRSKNKQPSVNLIFKRSKIETLNKTQIKRNFTMADSGLILCCLYYDYKYSNGGKDIQITRFVVNKTLLKYQSDESMSPSPAGNEVQSTTSAHDYSWLIYVSVAFIGLSILMLALCIISKKGWFRNSPAAEERVEFNNQVDQNQVLYADLEFMNNVNRTRNQNEEPHYANTNRPINQNEEPHYANANRPINQNEEESHYASIVGVLHPH